MKMLIDKIKLQLLLEKRKNNIKHSIEGIDILITFVVYVVSLLCCDFKSVFGINQMVISTLAWIIAVVIGLYGIIKLIRSFTIKYDHNILFHEIENLDEVVHQFSIVAVKDNFNKYANRFLLYYDVAWNCWFFFSFKTSEYQNEENIAARLSNALKIDAKNIKINYITDRYQPKFSEKDKVSKVYQHSLYQCEISKFSDQVKQDEFELDGVKYKWVSIAEMEKDDNIMSKNSDVVSFVKEKIS